MSLILYMHPLSSYCHKALIALYENDTPFEVHLLDLMKDSVREDFKKISPFGKMPALRDETKRRTVLESSIIIEYLDEHYPGKTKFLPEDPELRLETRLRDRLYDSYLHHSMQKVVLDRLRPEGKSDPYGVEQAKKTIQTAYQLLDRQMASQTWAMGEGFTLADCSAAPALFYANTIVPLEDGYPNAFAYLQRLKQRPSYARVLKEAEPYFSKIPKARK